VSGIGQATSSLFEQMGIQIVLCGRRMERLMGLQAVLAKITALCALLLIVVKISKF